MGLLDDAIREHLDLKRKHGAGEDELRRQEVEALGPARRDFSADAAAPEPAEPVSPEPADAGPEPMPEPAGWLDEDPGDVPFETAAETAPEPVAEEPMPAPDPAPAAAAPPVPEQRESDTPTQGFDALSRDDEPPRTADEPAPEGEEDVLEETPDFLQDTPEHDRLWFEQKPPRDFDFDG
jgi:hypothetical protein